MLTVDKPENIFCIELQFCYAAELKYLQMLLTNQLFTKQHLLTKRTVSVVTETGLSEGSVSQNIC